MQHHKVDLLIIIITIIIVIIIAITIPQNIRHNRLHQNPPHHSHHDEGYQIGGPALYI